MFILVTALQVISHHRTDHIVAISRTMATVVRMAATVHRIGM
jgi:hypothetical protein